MKHYRSLAALLALALLFSLAACGETPAPSDTENTPPTEIPAPTPTPEPTPAAPAFDHCELDMEYTRDATEIGTLTAYDAAGKALWEYVTEAFDATELEQVQSLGAGKDGWLLLCGGELRCIDEGEVVWVNTDFGGAGACWNFGPDGKLYLAGYYGPHLMVVDENGKTLRRWETFDSRIYWPADLWLAEDGMVELTFYSDRSILRVDPDTGTFEHAGWDYSAEYLNPVYVSTTEEFIDAIDHGTAVIMAPGVYNVTAYLNEHYLDEYWGEESLWQPTGTLVDFRHDGPELVISNINDLTIRSADPNAPAEIVCEPRYADVLSFFNCDNLELIDLTLGHTPEQGTCEGDVLKLNGCRNATLTGLDLYGCGAYALTAEDCRYVYCFLGRMHDCSYGIAVLRDVDYVQFDNVEFSDCREFTMFELENCQADFYDCSFERLDGNLVSAFDNASACFRYCSFDEAAEQSLQWNPQLGSVITLEE